MKHDDSTLGDPMFGTSDEWWAAHLDEVEFPTRLAPPGDGQTTVRHPETLALPLRDGVRARLNGPLLVDPLAIVLVTWSLVLARHVGVRDVVVGVTIPGGATVPLRLRVDAEMPISDWVFHVERDLENAARHAHSIQAVVRSGLFDTVVRLGPVADTEWSTAADSNSEVSLVASFDLGSHGQLGLAFAPERLSTSAVRRFGERVIQVLDRVLDAAVCRRGDLPVATEHEVARLIKYTETSIDLAAPTAPEAIRKQVAGRPEYPAILAGPVHLTYGELVERAARLANHLRATGVRPDDFVGILVPRTLDLPVAVLGVLFAGAAYVPLDPSYPADRVRFMLEDSNVQTVVTTGDWPFGATDADRHIRFVRLDADATAIAACAEEPPDIELHPRSAAYVVYTSGSTGRPKGAVIDHGNLATFLDWARHAFTGEELATVAWTASVCFDPTVFDLFATLSAGGTVSMLSDAFDLVDAARAGAPTLFFTVPSAMETLLSLGTVPSSVKTVILAGEALPRRVLTAIFDATQVERVVNLYGLSETTVYSTIASFRRQDVETATWDAAPIGRPIPGTTTWVLDDVGLPVPPGLVGELHLGGAAIGRGYLQRPALTAERFVPDSLGGTPGAVLYRTGDLVRMQPDGVLEYVGRRDHQVKVRGYRIELPEIELRLLAHPSVREAAVVVTGATAATRALAAFVVCGDKGKRVEPTELEAFLADGLPTYMVPSSITILDRLPRTPGGKLDRTALRPHDDTTATTTTALRTPTETALAAIWCEVLGVDRVTADDDFFRLGGQSLLAMQVVVRVREQLGTDVELTAVFEGRTLSALAATIDASRTRRNGSARITRSGRQRGPLSSGQAAMLAAGDDAGIAAVIPTFRLTGPVDHGALEGALNELVRRHQVLRTVYRSSLGRRQQLVLPWTHVPLTTTELSGKAKSPEAVRQVLVENVLAPFDLHNGPVIRWKFLKLGRQEHVLSIVIHEIAADGWSVPVLEAELSTLYSDFLHSRKPSLPDPAVQYVDFARWQGKHVTRAVRRRQLDFWKRRLRAAPLALDLLPDLHPETFDAPTAQVAKLAVGPDLADRLRAVARDEGATLFIVLVAALQAVVHRYTGSDRVVVRPTFAGRTSAEVESLLGFFVNFLLVDTDVSGDPTFRELVARTRCALLDATANADVHYTEVLRRVAKAKTMRTQWPAGLLRFQLLNFPQQSTLSLEGVRVQPEEPLAGTDHFALKGVERPDGSLTFHLDYDGSLFERATTERLLGRFHAALAAVADSPGVRIAELPLVDRREADQLVRLRRRPAKQAGDATVHELVSANAARSPDAVALEMQGESVTYRQLERLSDSVAGALAAASVAPETPVPLPVQPGPAFVAGLLGILKAGGVCVLTHETTALTSVVSNALADDNARPFVPRAVHPDQAALVVHSAGHGGSSPAVVLSHRALADAATRFVSLTGARRGDRCAELPALRPARLPSALLGSLVAGGCYTGDDGSGAAVCTVDGEAAATVASADGGPRNPLRVVVADGPVTAPAGRLRARVVEVFGASASASPWATADAPRSEATPTFRGVPDGADVVVLDASGNQAPPGVPGEVCIDGDSVARGYLDDPRATALRFVPHPFSDRPGARLFRTGLVGRVDAKNRVEVLGEGEGPSTARGHPMGGYLRRIEAAVRAHPDVAAAVARVEPALGDPRVHVYAVPRAGAGLRTRDVKELVPKGLPPIAAPLSVEIVASLPRQTDGRVDYEALGQRRR